MTMKDLPEATRSRLNELADTLRAQLGDDFVALIAFGSAVRGGWRERASDVDLVLVLREPTRAALAAIANTLTVARTARRFETIVLAAEELARAADVFPLFYDDIRRCHAVIAGEDVFADLAVSNAHRRLRIEQELREMQIRLRRVVIDAVGDADRLIGPVDRKVKQLRAPLHALLALRGTAARDDGLEAVIARAAEIYALDLAPLARVREDPLAALDALSDLLRRAIDEVDAMEAAP